MTSAMPNEIVGQLHSALQSGQIPARYVALGTQILDHLSEAVTVVVMGREGSGKSSLINMLLGGQFISPPAGIAVCEVVYGNSYQVTFGWPDGTTHLRTDPAEQHQPPAGADRMRYALPIEALKSHSYCEIQQPDDPALQRDMSALALARGQVFVWCSEGFDISEQQAWQGLPDGVKDHSFLALTKADRQIMKGDLSERLAELEDVASQEFLGLHPVATLHGLKARSGDSLQPDLWQASGGQDLLQAIEEQVANGRAAELDQAMMLLAQLGAAAPSTRKPDAAVQPAPPSPDTEVAEQSADLLEELQTHLRSAAQDMLQDMDEGKMPDADSVVSRCAATLDALTDKLSAADTSGKTATDCLLDDARDGAETLTLLQVEHSTSAAEDAVVLLLQLKKEIGGRASR